MTTLARIHGAKAALASLDDRSGSGTPYRATAAIAAGASTAAATMAAGFVHAHDACARRRSKGQAV